MARSRRWAGPEESSPARSKVHLVSSGLVGCCVALALLMLEVPQAQAEQVILNGFEQDFPAGAMGGIRKVIRYRQTRPDRTDTAITFLGGAGSSTLPEQIEILSQVGDQVHPVDSQGADCVLERTALIHQNGKVALIDAVRVFDTASMQAGYSSPVPLDLHVYQLEKSTDETESGLVFKASGKPYRTAPLCSDTDVRQAIATAARAIR